MIIHYPEQSWVIKIGLLIHLYFTRSHDLVKKSYESLYAAHVRVREKPKFHCIKIFWNKVIRRRNEHKDFSRYDTFEDKSKSSFAYEEKEKFYARTGLTNQLPFWTFYDTITNITFVYIVLRSLIPSKFIDLFMNGKPFKKYCILPGYFVVYHPLAEQFGVSLAIFHLVWRIYQWGTQRKFRINFIIFMIQGDREFERILKISGREYSKSIELDTCDCFFNRDPDDDEWYFEEFEDDEEELNLARISKEEKLISNVNSALTNYDDFLRYLMYFPVKYDTKIIYKLRPNRTKEARSQLTKQTIKFYKISFYYFGALFSTIFPIALYMIISDISYVDTYPGCWDFLENLHKEGKLDYYSLHLSGPKLYSNLVDGFVNFCTWIDSGAAVVFVIPIAYILNYDILLYWKHLQERLENVLLELKVDRLLTDRMNAEDETKLYANYVCNGKKTSKPDANSLDRLIEQVNHLSSPVETIVKIRSRTATVPTCYNEGKSTSDTLLLPDTKFSMSDGDSLTNLFKNRVINHARSKEKLSSPIRLKLNTIANESPRAKELENLIYVLQAELTDFFKQIEHVDVIVSDVLSAAFLIWFSTFALITYSTLTKSLVGNIMGLRMIQGIGFSAISMTSFMLLTLNHHTNRSYETICSIMAYDRSRFKKQFIKIIEFYTRRNCSSYTLFHSYPFLATTYLTAVAWNFSCATIVENLSMRT